MEILGFLSIMTEVFVLQRLSDVLATHSLGFFLTVSAHTTYTNVVYPSTHYPNHLPFTWPLVVHSPLNHFITDDILRPNHSVVTSARIKQGDTYSVETADSERRAISRRCSAKSILEIDFCRTPPLYGL